MPSHLPPQPRRTSITGGTAAGFCLLLLCLAGPCPALEDATHRVAREDVLVRAEPRFDAEVRGELRPDEPVRRLEVRGGWARVRRHSDLPGGWVLAAALEPVAKAPSPGSADPSGTGPEVVPSPTPAHRQAADLRSRLQECQAREAALHEELERAVRPGTGSESREPAAAEAEKNGQGPRAEEVEELRRETRRLAADLAERQAEVERFRKALASARTGEEDRLARAREEGASGVREVLEAMQEEWEKRLKTEVSEAREEGRVEGRRQAEAEAAEREEDWSRRLREERDRLEQEKARAVEEAVEEARRQERARVDAWMDDINDLRRRQKVQAREQAESHLETMHAAALRKQKLQLERECGLQLERLETRLRKEHAAELAHASTAAQQTFAEQLEAMRREERRRYQSSLEALEMVAGPGPSDGEQPEPSAPEEVDRHAPEPPQPACADRVASARRECPSAWGRAWRAECPKPELERAAAPVRAAAGPSEPCREEVHRALEMARREWQAETARYVEEAVARERARSSAD